MELEVKPGKYVVAVSGGVDSMALLDILRGQKQVRLVVAHFDHGIRTNSKADRQLVENTAQRYGLPFEYSEGKLGASVSEATARTARYKFLRNVQRKHNAQAIITAHHQDDLIETAMINLLRGTGRKGLTALGSTNDILRPLLPYSKKQLLEYATAHDLVWHEDSTNSDTRYLRNYVRLVIVPRLTDEQRQEFLRRIDKQRSVNTQLDTLLLRQLESPVERLQRRWFTMLPHVVAVEAMAAWLRLNGIRDFDKKTLLRAVSGAKTALPGKNIALKNGWTLAVNRDYLALTRLER